MGQRTFVRNAEVMRVCPGCGGTSTSVYRHPPANGRRDDYAESTRCADASCNRLLHYSPTNILTPGSRDFNMWEGTRSYYNDPAHDERRSW